MAILILPVWLLISTLLTLLLLAGAVAGVLMAVASQWIIEALPSTKPSIYLEDIVFGLKDRLDDWSKSR
jgi:hypothetical protein